MNVRDFGSTDREALRELYSNARRTLDDLPYTHEFETIFTEFVKRTGRTGATRHDVWRALISLRKRADLARKQR
jgi:hypothetical protein